MFQCFITSATVQSFGPFSSTSCGLIMFMARLSYILMMSLLCLHQTLKYLYIFKWESVAGWNEDFFTWFLALASFFLSTIFTFTSFQQEHYKLSAEYHLCVGFYMRQNESFAKTERTLTSQDPIHVYSHLVFTIVLLLSFRIALYSHKYCILSTVKRIAEALKIQCWSERLKGFAVNSDNLTTVTSFKDLFVEAGSSLAMASSVFAVIYVSTLKETFDYAFFNSPTGRVYIYATKLAMPSMPTVVLPLLVILKNRRMKDAVGRRIEQTFLVQYMRKTFNPDLLYGVVD